MDDSWLLAKMEINEAGMGGGGELYNTNRNLSLALGCFWGKTCLHLQQMDVSHSDIGNLETALLESGNRYLKRNSEGIHTDPSN